MKPFETIALSELHTIVGGEQPAAPVDAAALEEERLDRKFEEKQAFTRWEQHHRLRALICQGDRNCSWRN